MTTLFGTFGTLVASIVALIAIGVAINEFRRFYIAWKFTTEHREFFVTKNSKTAAPSDSFLYRVTLLNGDTYYLVVSKELNKLNKFRRELISQRYLRMANINHDYVLSCDIPAALREAKIESPAVPKLSASYLLQMGTTVSD